MMGTFAKSVLCRAAWAHAPAALLTGILLLAACAPAPPASAPTPAPPPLPREFRGVWVASVANIDWPSRPGLAADSQRAELVAMLDRAAELRLNAVILQMRPAGDALYASELEPWSEYLTGEMGRAPEPFYDPLEFAVREAHRRGLELHAWFNPYRARHPSARSAASADHISRTRPDLVRRYGTHLWMDPGEPEVQDHTVRVILDVVRRYDVDGVHIDDYFYPYRERDSAGVEIPFPDDSSYARYRAAGGRLEREDWRRHNVDALVRRLYAEIKAARPEVKFGVSPIGTWRPGDPPQIRGFDAYQQIYADARKWLREGWLDYFAPQLYWPIAQTEVSFPVLLDWWARQNLQGRHLWPGLIPNRVSNPDRGAWRAAEILGQVYVARGHPGAGGVIHFSMRSLMQSPDSLAERLARDAYAQPALVPASPWLGGRRPAPPKVRGRYEEGRGLVVQWTPRNGDEAWLWALQLRDGEEWRTRVLPGAARELTLERVPTEVWITAVGRSGRESRPAVVRPVPR